MITNQNPFSILSQLWTNLWAQTWWVFLGEYLAKPAAENAIFWVMTDAQVFGHGMLHYNSEHFKPVPDCFLACHSEVSFYYNDDDSYQICICFVYLLISCFASTDFLLHSCIRKENTQESTKWQRDVLSVHAAHACTFSSEALNDEYRKWHPMKIMVTDPQVRSFEGRWPLSTSRRVQKKCWKAWRAIQRWSFWG